MSKKLFKNLMAQKQSEFRKWASRYGLTFKTTSEMERERSVREKEQERVGSQRGDNARGGRGNKNHKMRNHA